MEPAPSAERAHHLKGRQRMRTLRELEGETEIINDPMDDDLLSDQPINDPDD
jgi:hypothetical protein